MRIRLEKLLEALGINQTEFCRSTGISKSRLSEVLKERTNNLSVDALQAICNTYPNINPTWLLTGDGEMFLPLPRPLSEAERGVTASKFNYRLDEEEKELIDLLRSKKKGKDKIFIALKALLGLGMLLGVVNFFM